MTFEKILNDLTFNIIDTKKAFEEINSKEKMKRINYYAHIENITKEPLKDGQLQELNAIVGVLQILYNSSIGSPVSDSTYDTLQEMLVDLGIPRLTGSIEINSASKLEHKYKNLRGTLDKVYYLTPNEKRTNKSRKYLDDWIKSAESLYEKNTGNKINLNEVRIIIQPKFDGVSAVRETEKKRKVWISRGDTRINKASDVSHIMNIFDSLWEQEDCGIKFEVMMTEDNKNRINELYRNRHYKNSRQIVTATLNSNEADFKADYLYPVPLRIMYPGDDVESIHPDLMEKFPTTICTFGDRDIIRKFANENRWIVVNGMRLRTDGAVMTILDSDIQKALGRSNNINNFEVAYKFTEEAAYTKVKNIEFYVSEFGYITPVLVVNDVILKGNTVNRISLSNRERFDELGFSYGDDVKILYDIIPYATIDEKCRRVKNGRKIDFVKECPCCHAVLDLTKVQVQCVNPECSSRIIGRILNYCSNLRIQNIGYQTLDILYAAGLLKNGIRSLYKLKKKTYEIEEIEGFGKLKTRKIVAEIEAKRRLSDYEFFGSIGIGGLSIKTFESIFNKIPYTEFLNMIKLKNFDLLMAKLLTVDGIGSSKAETLIDFLKDTKQRIELLKLINVLTIIETYDIKKVQSKGKIVFTGCRPSKELSDILKNNNWKASDSWSKEAKYLIIPNDGYSSSKVAAAIKAGVPIIALNGINPLDVLTKSIPDLL